MLDLAPQRTKLSYHGGELRIQYEYSAPRMDKMWRCIHHMMPSHFKPGYNMVLYSPPRNKKYVCTASMIMTSYFPPRMIFVSSTTIYSSRNSGLVGRSCKVQYSLKSIEKKNVYVASGIEPATINLCHNIVFLRLIAWYSAELWH